MGKVLRKKTRIKKIVERRGNRGMVIMEFGEEQNARQIMRRGKNIGEMECKN